MNLGMYTPQRFKSSDYEEAFQLMDEYPFATVIFSGPHSYITPTWYTQDDVPTWNYSTVQVRGDVELMESQEDLVHCLQTLSSHAERHWPSGWKFSIPEDLSGENLKKHIVGFKVKVTDINYKKKLSQNRSVADRAGILKGLQARKDQASHEVMADMLKMYDADGELKK